MSQSDTVTVTREAWNDLMKYVQNLEERIEDLEEQVEDLQWRC